MDYAGFIRCSRILVQGFLRYCVPQFHPAILRTKSLAFVTVRRLSTTEIAEEGLPVPVIRSCPDLYSLGNAPHALLFQLIPEALRVLPVLPNLGGAFLGT